DDDRSANTFGLLMSLNMLVETPGGFDYTGSDCMGWMKEAGFRETRVEHLVGPDSMVIAIKRRPDWRLAMTASRSHGLPSPQVCAGIVVAMLAMIVIPAAITLGTVQHPAPLQPVDQGSTPHGYTFSLLLFVVPSAVIFVWFIPREGL